MANPLLEGIDWIAISLKPLGNFLLRLNGVNNSCYILNSIPMDQLGLTNVPTSRDNAC